MSGAAEQTAASPASDYAVLAPGDPAPRFHQRTHANPKFAFDTVAGRYVVLCFFASASTEHARAALTAVEENRDCFDDQRACFFGVSIDPRDRVESRVRESLPGLRYFFDEDGAVSRLYGAIPNNAVLGVEVRVRPFWMVLDPMLRVMRVIPFAEDGGDRAAVFDCLRALPPPERSAGFEMPPPILILPRVFEPELCERLIGVYDADGGRESGFMREVDGRTVEISDASYKRRRDVTVKDPALVRGLQARIIRRINPELARIFAFNATRMERYIVGCYTSDDGGHFRAHRDNTTKGTEHRRFAVSINLNEDFDGGEVSFPEYHPRGYKAPAGGAVIFPCNLLHAVSKVTRGRRYAFLPFLYDEAAAKMREANNVYLADGAEPYVA